MLVNFWMPTNTPLIAHMCTQICTHIYTKKREVEMDKGHNSGAGLVFRQERKGFKAVPKRQTCLLEQPSNPMLTVTEQTKVYS